MGEGRTGLDDVEATERFLLQGDAETALSPATPSNHRLPAPLSRRNARSAMQAAP